MNDNNDFNDIEFLDLDETADSPSLEADSVDLEKNFRSQRSSSHNTSHTSATSTSSRSSSGRSGSHSSSSASRAKKRKKKKRKMLIQRLIFLAAFVVFIVSGVILANTLLNYHKADVIYQSIEDAVFSAEPLVTNNTSNTNNTPDTQEELPPVLSEVTGETVKQDVILTNYDHAALKALNSDAVGYLQIPAIDVLLPVVQGTDNSYYLSHAINGAQSSNGTLFIDCGNKDGIESQNAIIYGHNMKNGSMFGSLKKYNNKDFFNTEGNQYFYFYTDKKIYKYQIYSVHVTPAVSETYTTEFGSRDAFFTYIDTMCRASYYKCNLDFYEDSKTVTFSTCTNDDATRLVVQGVRIDEMRNQR